MIRGRWKQKDRGYGLIKGLLASSEGVPIGHMKGVYGVKEDGEQKWVAKMISRVGRFRGIAIGTYADGHFEGNLYNRDRDVIGDVSGRYFQAEDEERHGSYEGIYALACDVEEEAEAEAEAEEATDEETEGESETEE